MLLKTITDETGPRDLTIGELRRLATEARCLHGFRKAAPWARNIVMQIAEGRGILNDDNVTTFLNAVRHVRRTNERHLTGATGKAARWMEKETLIRSMAS